jgi:hypothetical protein
MVSMEIFVDIILPAALGSTQYQEYFMGIKAAGA